MQGTQPAVIRIGNEWIDNSYLESDPSQSFVVVAVGATITGVFSLI